MPDLIPNLVERVAIVPYGRAITERRRELRLPRLIAANQRILRMLDRLVQEFFDPLQLGNDMVVDEKLFVVLSASCWMARSLASEPIDIGSRRELFVDHALIERLDGRAELKLHHPMPREIAMTFDKPWEGNASGYPTVFQPLRLRVVLRDADLFSFQSTE